MAQIIIVHVLVPIFLLVLVAGAGGTPPGIAKNPSHASCQIKKYKHCYNLEHVCPKFCPDGCTVECASCKPICVGGANPPPQYSPTPSTPNNPKPSLTTPSIPDHNPPPSSSTPPHSTPSPKNPPPSPTPSTPENPPPSPPTPSTPKNPPPSTPSTPKNLPPSTPSPKNSPPSPSTPPPSPPAPSTPSENPPPSSRSPTTPENPPPTSSTPPSSPKPANPPPNSPTPPSTSSPKKARCMNKNYPKCYNMEHVCPNGCRGGCEVDCYTCKPVCKCDRPGAVCQDPRFIGGDGITFYFHGKKDSNFCLVSDPNLHINAHFIGRRNENMKRDFTWVQSIAILFDNHQLFIGAHKTSIWEDSIDRLALSFDSEPITLHESEGATWKSPSVNIVRSSSSTNNVIIEVEGRLRITAKVVPITEEESRIHNYGITQEDCFAHLDLGFKFFSLSNQVSGVLGQTYKPNYVSRVNIGAKMPIMGGGKEFETTSLFAPDCSVARFVGHNEHNDEVAMEMPSLNCASGIDGQGVVCRR